jgi:hypothetical protein
MLHINFTLADLQIQSSDQLNIGLPQEIKLLNCSDNMAECVSYNSNNTALISGLPNLEQ